MCDGLDELGMPDPALQDRERGDGRVGGPASRYIIRRIRLAHCKRGPSRCHKCREMTVERVCLLDIAPPDSGLAQRRVIEVVIAGESVWREFDIVRTFESEGEAHEYAAQHGIQDIDL